MRILVALVLVCGCASQKHMLKTQRDGERLRMELAMTYVDRGAYEAAIPLLLRELRDHPERASLHTLYGKVLRERGLYPQAEKELLMAQKLQPRSPAAWAEAAILYDLERRPGDAEAAHRRALALAPRSAEYWNNLGFSLYVAGKTEDAVAALERALALDPGLTVAYNNLGFAYGRRGDLTGAERCFRTAGGELAAKLNLALVHEQRGELQAAERMRAAARAIDPAAEEKVQ